MEKSCSNCSQQAQFSLNVLISSLGGQRIQKTTRAVLFCSDCLDELTERLCSDALSQAVNNALTVLKDRLHKRSTAKTSACD
jgi:hypothetical protein